MVDLGEVLGALISQVNKGRAQADMEIARVAEIYKESPNLSSFSVPRMVLDEAVIDLKVAVAEGPSRGVVLTPESRLKILNQIEELVKGLPNLPNLPARTKYLIDQTIHRNSEIWDFVLKRISEELSEIVPSEVEVKPKSITASAAATIQWQIVQGLLYPETERELPRLIPEILRSVQVDTPEMEKYLKSEIGKIIDEVIKAQPSPKDGLDVLVSASDLQGIPPEKITTVRLTLRESDLSWVEMEKEDGKVEKKLAQS